MKTKKEPTTETCPDCKNVAHKPGMSEFSNCGESEISHSRYDDVRENLDTEIY